jgi:hypothetical protein
MQNEIESKLLEFYDFRPDAATGLPPSVWVKTRISLRLNRDVRRVAFHNSIDDSAYSSGMVSRDHEHDGPELMLVAPLWKNQAFTFGSILRSGNFHDVRYAKPTELANLPCACILVREAPPDKLEIFSTRGVGKDGNSRRNAALHEVRRFKRSCAIGIKRYDNGVSNPNRFVDDERPSCSSQNSFPNRRNGNDGSHDEGEHN